MKIQTRSKKCQNKLKQTNRRNVEIVTPQKKTCVIITPIQRSPIVTWRPWVPTKEKNEDKKALRAQLFPSSTSCINSLSSIPTKEAPNKKETENQVMTFKTSF